MDDLVYIGIKDSQDNTVVVYDVDALPPASPAVLEADETGPIEAFRLLRLSGNRTVRKAIAGATDVCGVSLSRAAASSPIYCANSGFLPVTASGYGSVAVPSPCKISSTIAGAVEADVAGKIGTIVSKLHDNGDGTGLVLVSLGVLG